VACRRSRLANWRCSDVMRRDAAADRIDDQWRSLTPAPLPSGRGVPRALRHNPDAPSLLPDGRRWRGAPDEGLPFQWKAQRLRFVSAIRGGPSSLPFSLISGLPEISTQSFEVGNSRLRCGRRFPRALRRQRAEPRRRTLSCKERAGRGVGRSPHEAQYRLR
jgi:hypothetical protein